MTFRYVSSNGEAFDFEDASPYYADGDALRIYDISYDMIRNTVTRFNHDAPSLPLPIRISAATPQEGAELLDNLQKAFDHDVRMSTPGRIELDGFYVNAYVTTFGIEEEEMHDLFEIALQTNVLLPNPRWIREITKHFPAYAGVEGGGFNFPIDFPFDFGVVREPDKVNALTSWPCGVRITIYGPASKPSVAIGQNRYEVNVEVKTGGRLVIDCMDKSKIDLYDQYGNVENVFGKRADGAAGSGTYVFEEVPAGDNIVSWDGSFALDITLYHERSFVPC